MRDGSDNLIRSDFTLVRAAFDKNFRLRGVKTIERLFNDLSRGRSRFLYNESSLHKKYQRHSNERDTFNHFSAGVSTRTNIKCHRRGKASTLAASNRPLTLIDYSSHTNIIYISVITFP